MFKEIRIYNNITHENETEPMWSTLRPQYGHNFVALIRIDALSGPHFTPLGPERRRTKTSVQV